MTGIHKFLDKFYPLIKPIAEKRRCVTVHPADMFFAQVKNGEFARLDIISRYLFLENYYGENDYGLEMYKKLYMARINTCNDMVRNFNNLIASYHKNGYDKTSFLQVSRGLSLKNGNHRFSLAVYHNEPVVLYVEDYDDVLRYDADWYRSNGFTEQEISILTDKADELYKKLNKPVNIFLFGQSEQEISAVKKVLQPFGTITDTVKPDTSADSLFAFGKGDKTFKKLYSLCKNSGNTTVIKLILNIPDVGFVNKTKKVYIKQLVDVRKSLKDIGIEDKNMHLPLSFEHNEHFSAFTEAVCNSK